MCAKRKASSFGWGPLFLLALPQRNTRSGSASGSLAPLDAKTCANASGKAHVADGRDVLIVRQVLRLAIDVQPRQQLIAGSQVQLRVAVIQVAVGQQQAVAAVQMSSQPRKSESSERLAKAELNRAVIRFCRIAGRKEPRVRRPAERPSARATANTPRSGMPLYVGTGPSSATSSFENERCTTASR